MTEQEICFIREKALRIRQLVLRSAWKANGGHIAPAFSCTDIIATLYFGCFADGGGERLLKYRTDTPEWDDRDYFVLSKGHGGLALYAALALAGYFPDDQLDYFCTEGSKLGSLASIQIPGVEATTGSLGHGLSFGLGIALACKKDGLNNHIYVMVGDGECEEGSEWEALIAANHYRLDNVTIIVDHNKLQAMDTLERILSFENLKKKAECFGMQVIEIDGHDIEQINEAVSTRVMGKTILIVANTVKGKGISFMENDPIWHYRIPSDDEMNIALRELGMTKDELGEKHSVSQKVYI